MIMVDAGVLIAAGDPRDIHHDRATAFLDEHGEDGFCAPGITIAESLVRSVSSDGLDDLLEDYEIIGITALDLPGEAAAPIARIRAETKLRMPDALVLYSCERERVELVTTDLTLARVAIARGVRVHDLSGAARERG